MGYYLQQTVNFLTLNMLRVSALKTLLRISLITAGAAVLYELSNLLLALMSMGWSPQCLLH
jgi:hypothetical protein